MARKMVEEEGYDCLYFGQVAKRLAGGNALDFDDNQRWGGNVFRGDGGYWTLIGTVYVGNSARGTNNSHRGLWAPTSSKKYCAKPSEDVLKQGHFDLTSGRPTTKDAAEVLKWINTEVMIQELNRKLRLEK
jgi:hypothetical protein